jgi:D-amino-acid dehydrogenase
VVVAGAGVVGMACARALQRAGYQVCVADPEPPGSGCSHGNAGVVTADHVLPMARWDILRQVPRMLLDRRGPLYLKARRLPGLLPWFMRFAVACRGVEAGSRAIAALTRHSVSAWQAELSACGAVDLLATRGMYTVYGSPRSYQADALERRLAADLGVAWEPLDGPALRAREPALSDKLTHGVFFPAVAHVLNPRALVQQLAAAFTAAGGVLVTEPVRALASQPHQVVVSLSGRRLRCRYVVLAAALGTRELCAQLGVRLPLVAEMGYHLSLPEPVPRLTAPVAVAEHGFIITPMAGHLRLAGTVEFARRQMPPSWHRADLLRPLAAAVLREPLPEPTERWRGSRPTLPDFLPAIGPLPGEPRVLVACGHQHIGLTTAAVTGAMVRDLIAGGSVNPDPAPYAPGRFA